MTSELISLGFAASQAGLLAFTFTEVGADGPEDISFPRMVESKGPLFLAVNPAHNFWFTYFSSGKSPIDEVLTEAAPRGEAPLVSVTVINCTALLERVRTILNERGA
jgi:hypothetical protein